MNKYYTNKIKNEEIEKLRNLRGAHNLWYVYSKPQLKEKIKVALKMWIEQESKIKDLDEKYSHEKILDECGFSFKESLPLNPDLYLWEIKIEK